MKVTVAYITLTNGIRTLDFAARFGATLHAFDPGYPFELVAACNGGPPTRETKVALGANNCRFLPRVNDPGWDVTAYQEIAHREKPDMLVCLGESVYFHRAGWLKKLVDAWQQFGPGMYGIFSSFFVRPHLNTTGFVVAPDLLLSYPPPKNREQRYHFEHGENALWIRVKAAGRPALLVTWNGIWEPFQWRLPNNILWRGDQSNCLAWCIHSDRYRNLDDRTKRVWEINADLDLSDEHKRSVRFSHASRVP